MAQEASVVVHDVGVAVKHGRQHAVAPLVHIGEYVFECLRRRKHVAGVEKHYVVARGTGYAFVHGVVESAVGFGCPDHGVLAVLVSPCGVGVMPYHAHRAVFRSSIHYDVLHLLPRLLRHAVEGTLQNVFGVICAGYD